MSEEQDFQSSSHSEDSSEDESSKAGTSLAVNPFFDKKKRQKIENKENKPTESDSDSDTSDFSDSDDSDVSEDETSDGKHEKEIVSVWFNLFRIII